MKKHPSEGAHQRARTLRRQMTEAEKRLWMMLRSGQTEGYRFRRQVPIGQFIADFVCHAAKLIIEVDGGQHDLSSKEEARRTRFLEGEGYRVLRFWNNEVLENPEGARTVIAENLHRVTPTHTLPHQGGGPQATLEDLADPVAENRRLREELHEALAREAAMAEVLQVIHSSPGDLAPVFDAILEKAHTLCGAEFGSLFLYDGEHFRAIVSHGVPEALASRLREGIGANGSRSTQQLIAGAPFAHIHDSALEEHAVYRGMDMVSSHRTLLSVPLRKGDALLGMIVAGRLEVRPFTDKQIALLQNFAAQAVIAMENARLLTETREALEQQTATTEVLQVINSSPGDLAPVFNAMLENAMRLCEAAFGGLWTLDEEHYVAVALRNVPTAYAEFLAKTTVIPGPGTAPHRFLQGERLVHNFDLESEEPYKAGDPQRRALVDLGGARTALQVPLCKDDRVLGVITIYRQEVRPFTDKQIALLQNFAAQAVIAMENARLITETREALEQQTATAEVLQVINSSPGDLTPVFDAILEKAHSLCGAPCGSLQVYDGERFRAVATRNLAEPFVSMLREGYRPDANELHWQMLSADRGVVQFADFTEVGRSVPDAPIVRAGVEIGLRTVLLIPLRKDTQLLGRIVAARQEVRPFTDKQIALLENFAAQAVIAMENARLLTETREALEQQTATAEVLQVINSSPGDLAPVFDAILEKAHSLCGAEHGALTTYDGEHFRAVALHAMPEQFGALLRQPFSPYAGGAQELLLRGAPVVHIPDILARHPTTPIQHAAIEAGIRTLLMVPLRKDDRLLGYITANRREVRPFTDKQIALLENFAAQAVIAMENARLLTETREALEQQTATAEVLQVINSSPGDLAPVFDAMLDKAIRLCEATHGHLFTYDGERFHPAVARGDERYIEWARQAGPVLPYQNAPLGRIKRGEQIVHVADIREEEVYRAVPRFRESAELRGVRSQITVALSKDSILLGTIVVYRREVRPFTDKQIALLQNFAAQAVIAMENARLITETREALEQQTATAEVLQVINSSPGDLVPVFDAILDKAHRLCGVEYGVLLTYDGELFWPVAVHGAPPNPERRNGFRPSSGFRGLLRGERLLHIYDMAEAAAERPDEPVYRDLFESSGIRTQLAVPLRKDGTLLGIITANRREVRPFTDKQIALLENFAAQAVIAIENARLLTETREALEQQTATAEVLQVINSSPGDLAPVFDAMLERGIRLCEASFGVLCTFDGERFQMAAARGVPAAYAEYLQCNPLTFAPGSGPASVLAGQRFHTVVDFRSDQLTLSGDPQRRALVELGGARSGAAVPLCKDAALLGIFLVFRPEVRPFTEKQIALLENFAAQAVIAMENARLINETREALEQQTATAEVLQVINSSPGDLAPVFEAVVEKATRLCEATHGYLFTYDGERFHPGAEIADSRCVEWTRQHGPFQPPANTALGRIRRGERLVHVADITKDDSFETVSAIRQMAEVSGARSVLTVALRRDEVLLGGLGVYRQEVRPFTDKQIALLQNFAAQAVIAMENARLLTETREALEQQTATAEVLQVINSSPGDLAPVFGAMLEKATRLCDAAYGLLATYDADGFHGVAATGLPMDSAEALSRIGHPPAATALGQLERSNQTVQIADISSEPAYSDVFRVNPWLRRVRTNVVVPMLKEAELIGAFIIFREEVRLFSDKQIALLQNFAAQAVIAIENARLLTETREALEQQTATAEVLQVINSSPGDLAPVFDAILEKAHTLCAVTQGALELYDGETFRAVTTRGLSDNFDERVRKGYRGTENPVTRPLLGGAQFNHITDLGEIDHPMSKAAVEIGGLRTSLFIPLRKDGALLGQIVASRREVRPFTDKQIALLQNFAAQAVIAMENARLLGELRQRTEDLQESLEYQTATSDVLNVINRSAFDLETVLQTVAATAVRLCRADSATIYRNEGGEYRWAGGHLLVPEYEEIERNVRILPGQGTVVGRCVLAGGTVQILDAWTDPLYEAKEDARIGGVHTMIGVPLLRDGAPIGAIGLARRRIEAFSEQEIQLVSTFADQAAIAIENARLLTETREALEQQTATAEVLQVINSSPGDLAPVFNAILEKALRLCDAGFGHFRTSDGERFPLVAVRGDQRFVDVMHQRAALVPGPHHPLARIIAGEDVNHIADAADSDAYRNDPRFRELVDTGVCRSLLGVALRKDKILLGYLVVYRQEVRPFSEKETALLQNFAAQAVIAMENARLIDEIRQRQAELRVTFDNMGDGVVMFDQDLRLTAWNRNFQELLDLPDAVLASRLSYAEYLRILAERGEFGGGDIEGELSRRLAETDEELRLERTRPDGRVIEVRRNAVPGGGFVLIYSDITERKEAEARLRAARDTAEGALRELRAAQTNLIHAEKMASLGQLTAGIAHEIKNPLNFVNNFAGLSVELLDELKEAAAPAVASLGEDERAEIDDLVTTLSGNLDKIAEHGRRADGIVSSMLLHSRGGSGERRQVDLNALVDEALNLAYHGARAQDQSFEIVLERDFDRDARPIELVPQDITRVLLNLIGNGFYAASTKRRAAQNGTPAMLKVTTCELGEAVEIRVRDNGGGIPPEIREKLFQPFFTTKPSGEGTGLGLSISWDIVTQQHGGTIEVDSRPGEYTEFTVQLPRSPGSASVSGEG